MKSIPRFEQVLNKDRDKNIAEQPILQPQLSIVHCIIFPSNKD